MSNTITAYSTPEKLLMGQIKDSRMLRLEKQTNPAYPTVEFGFWQALIGVGTNVVGSGIEAYASIKASEQQRKAAEAQAKAASEIARVNAESKAKMMRTLAPVLALTVVGGMLVTIVLVKKKKAR